MYKTSLLISLTWSIICWLNCLSKIFMYNAEVTPRVQCSQQFYCLRWRITNVSFIMHFISSSGYCSIQRILRFSVALFPVLHAWISYDWSCITLPFQWSDFSKQTFCSSALSWIKYIFNNQTCIRRKHFYCIYVFQYITHFKKQNVNTEFIYLS